MVTPLHDRPRTSNAPGTGPHPPPQREPLGYRRRRPYTARQTRHALVVAFAVAILLGSQALVHKAEQLPFGWKRDAALSLANANDRISHLLSLNRPADAVNRALGRRPTSAPLDVTTLLNAPPVTASTIPLDVNPATGLRWITREAPLRVLFAGDSMMRELGTSSEDAAPADLTRPSVDFRVSSGLSRPDFFDWPAHLISVLDRDKPESVVLLFGTNDFQDVEVDGQGILQAGSASWMAEYSRRVALVMDLLHRPGLTVHWVGLPPMRSASFSASMASLNEVFRTAAASRPWVSFVDLGPTLAGPDGGYATYLPGDGDVLLRQDDGVHLSRQGADRAAAVVLADIKSRWGF